MHCRRPSTAEFGMKCKLFADYSENCAKYCRKTPMGKIGALQKKRDHIFCPKNFSGLSEAFTFGKIKRVCPQKLDVLGTLNTGASPIAQKVVGPDFLYLEKNSKIEKK